MKCAHYFLVLFLVFSLVISNCFATSWLSKPNGQSSSSSLSPVTTPRFCKVQGKFERAVSKQIQTRNTSIVLWIFYITSTNSINQGTCPTGQEVALSVPGSKAEQSKDGTEVFAYPISLNEPTVGVKYSLNLIPDPLSGEWQAKDWQSDVQAL